MNNAKAVAQTDTTTVELESLDSVLDSWSPDHPALAWNCLFVLPMWLRAWWKNFGRTDGLNLISIRQNDRTIGIAPILRDHQTASLIGDQNVCDYLDFIVTPDRASEFYRTLLHQIRQDGITHLEVGLVRADSSAYTVLLPEAEQMGYRVHCQHAATSYELALPDSWDAYLDGLSGKERHEIRRKLRRLNRAGSINFRLVEDPALAKKGMETFLQLFKMNRSDKATFLSDQMESFFKDLANHLAAHGLLRLYILELNRKPIAAVMCFDYQSTRYLYNNGYDSRFSPLSAGLISKILSIKDCFGSGIKTYDFLKGSEVYKQRLGGRPVELFQCRVELS